VKPTADFLIATYPGRKWKLPTGGEVADITWFDGAAPADIADKLAAYDPDAPVPKTVFSSLEYLSKFSDTEYTAVRSGPMALQRGLDSLIAAQFVDLADPRTAMYLSGMVAAGIIDEARKAELLTPTL